MPRALRPMAMASTRVVPPPAKGSITQSPGLVKAWMTARTECRRENVPDIGKTHGSAPSPAQRLALLLSSALRLCSPSQDRSRNRSYCLLDTRRTRHARCNYMNQNKESLQEPCVKPLISPGYFWRELCGHWNFELDCHCCGLTLSRYGASMTSATTDVLQQTIRAQHHLDPATAIASIRTNNPLTGCR